VSTIGRDCMKLPRRNFLHLAAGAAALPAVSWVAWAQAYPTRPVRFIVPFPASGPSDVLARLYGQKLSQRWNQPVVVENRVGATGTIGTEAVVRAPPDGYTLLFTADLPITMAPALLKLRYDPQRDLVPVAALAKNDALLVVHPSAGIRSLADLVAAAKAKPGALTFASGGNASPSHLCGEMLKRQAGIDMTHVPYSGSAPAMNAVLAGDVTMFCAPIPLGMVHFKAGKIYALGVTGTAPSPLLPELAPLSAIYPGFVISTWQALFAPVATPPAATKLLHDELQKAYADPELQQKLATLALDPAWLSGAELSRRIETDAAKWADLIKAANKAE
jgi:tripartite-type tricarboxylate transporter receptor subunit TctC